MKKENSILSEKVKDLRKSLSKCFERKEKLDARLGKQKCSLDKAGLGFDASKRRNFPKKNLFPLLENIKLLAFIVKRKAILLINALLCKNLMFLRMLGL